MLTVQVVVGLILSFAAGLIAGAILGIIVAGLLFCGEDPDNEK